MLFYICDAVTDPSTNITAQKLCGDIDYEAAKNVAGFITPVPGGVGPMTVAMLMKNTVQSYLRSVQRLTRMEWNLAPLKLNLVKPVPRYVLCIVFILERIERLKKNQQKYTLLACICV